MSNFTVNGVYSYTSSNLYSYLGRVPTNERNLKEAFFDFGIKPTGSTDDLKKLNSAMYKEYSNQVQNQIENQNSQQNIPWAGLCAQIGIQATGDYDTDLAAFNNAIQLLSQSAIDGQAMAFFAGIKSEAQIAFGLSNKHSEPNETISFYQFKGQYLS